jgi:hypothetical protein
MGKYKLDVIPAEAGIQFSGLFWRLDTGIRRYDNQSELEFPVDDLGYEPVEGYRIILEFWSENQAGTGVFLRHESVVDATQVFFGLFLEILQLEILAFDLESPVVRVGE